VSVPASLILARTVLLTWLQQPQYAVPESLLPPRPAHSSRAESTLHTPPNEADDLNRRENHTAILKPESSVPVRSQPDLGSLALDAQSQSLPPLAYVRYSKDLLRNKTPSDQLLDETPNLAFQTTEEDLHDKDSFLSEYRNPSLKPFLTDMLEMADISFFPSPAMTDPWGETSASELPWNSTMELPFLVEKPMPTAEPDTVSDREFSTICSTISTPTTPSREKSQLDTSASVKDRLSHVLKAVDAAGFDSLDSAIIAYYKKSLDEDEGLRREQRLNRIRRLPALLKELHLAAQGWSQWQRRGFEEQIIRSTEDILLTELENHLSSRRDQSRLRDDTEIEAEVGRSSYAIGVRAVGCANLDTIASEYVDAANVTLNKIWHHGFERLADRYAKTGRQVHGSRH
jgi:hypothetical protein